MINNSRHHEFAYACLTADLKSIKEIAPNVNINAYNGVVLKQICSGGNLEVAQFLMSLPDIEIDTEQLFALTCAKGHLNIVKILVEQHGADIYYEFCDGFKSACQYGYLDVCSYLIMECNIESSEIDEFLMNNTFSLKCEIEAMFCARAEKKLLWGTVEMKKHNSVIKL